MDYKKLSKNELIALVKSIESILNGITTHQQEQSIFNISVTNVAEAKSDLENLIGTIPFLLLNQNIFERNQDIANFAQSLGIHIPSPEKKKREDMIGRIVSAIASFDEKKIIELNKALKLNKKSVKNDKSNFFKDWEIAIKEMAL
jgi:hypothetical protein